MDGGVGARTRMRAHRSTAPGEAGEQLSFPWGSPGAWCLPELCRGLQGAQDLTCSGAAGQDSPALCYVCLLIVCRNLAHKAIYLLPFVSDPLLWPFAVAATGCQCSDVALDSFPLAKTLKKQVVGSAAIIYPWAFPSKCLCWGGSGETISHQRRLETDRTQKT